MEILIASGARNNLLDEKKVMHERGFTLIELMIVIGILGIMAIAILVSIDPFEQLKKGTDTNIKNISVEFLNATVKYYTIHNALPWSSVAQGGANCYPSGLASGVAISNLANDNGCLQTLINEGELKQSFLTSNYLSSIVATNPNPQTGNTTEVIVCFMPTSRSQQKDPGTKYNQDGTTAAAGSCKSQGGASSCYSCAQ